MRVLLFLPLLVTLVACTTTGASQSPDYQAELEHAWTEFTEAMDMRDAERVAQTFAPDGGLHIANMPPVYGEGPIQQFYEQVLPFLESTVYSPERTEISASQDMAWIAGRVQNVFRNGEQFDGKFLLLWERHRGGWQLSLYSLSSNSPSNQG